MSSTFIQSKLAGDEDIGKAVAIYKDILVAKRKQFPYGFFKGALQPIALKRGSLTLAGAVQIFSYKRGHTE